MVNLLQTPKDYPYFSLRNRKELYSFDSDPVRFLLPTTDNFSSLSQKVQGIELRLQYEYKNCLENHGQVYFLTFTYNNKAIPSFLGVPCPDKKDMQRFLNHSQFAKKIKRYGFTFRYFVGIELGEGGLAHGYKGKRGRGNNPHYHVLFFCYPINEHASMTDQQFNRTAMEHWQGVNNKGRLLDYRRALYGHVSISKKGSRVYDYKALTYVSKYVVKDAQVLKREQLIKAKIYETLNTDKATLIMRYQDILKKCPINKEGFHISQLFRSLGAAGFSFADLWQLYKTRYGTRPMYSQGLGVNAVYSISEKGLVSMDGPDGPKFVTPPLYLFRKKYTDTLKNEKGSNVYVLNEDGQKLRNMAIKDKVLKTFRNVMAFSLVLDDPDFKRCFKNSHLNHSLNYEADYSYLQSCLRNTQFAMRYALYTNIYKNRYYNENFPAIRPFTDDYPFFNVYGVSTQPRYEAQKDYQLYQEHPFFAVYLYGFNLLDSCNLYLKCQKLKVSKDAFFEKKDIKQRLTQYIKNYHLCIF